MAWENLRSLRDEIEDEFAGLSGGYAHGELTTSHPWSRLTFVRTPRRPAVPPEVLLERALAYQRKYDSRPDVRERKHSQRKAKRAAERGGKPKQSWKLSTAQKTWARENGLGVRETARQLGVAPAAVRKIRRAATALPALTGSTLEA